MFSELQLFLYVMQNSLVDTFSLFFLMKIFAANIVIAAGPTPNSLELLSLCFVISKFLLFP